MLQETEHRQGSWHESAPCFLASDPHATGRRILELTQGRCQFSARGDTGYAFRNSNQWLGGASLQRLSWDTLAACQTRTRREPDDHYTLHVVLRGRFEAMQGKDRAAVAAAQMLLVGDPGWVRREWIGECEVFNLSMDRQSVARVLASELAVDLRSPLQFDHLATAGAQATATFARYLDHLWLDLAGPEPCFVNARLSRQAERTLALMLLQCFGHNYRRLLDEPEPRAAPFYVRRAQEFIHAHADRHLMLGDLVEAAGVSARSLHYGFQASHGVSPMQYLKQVRLGQARDALTGPDRGESITSIALRCGYSNLSRFSRDYKAQFGVSPARSRRRA